MIYQAFLFFHIQIILKQAPYQEITYNEYRKWLKKTTDKVDWSAITEYETKDNTENTKELACSAGTCEII